MTEEWRDIPGFEGFYQASNTGRIRSLDRIVTRMRRGFEQKYFKAGIVLKSTPTKRGYFRVLICIDPIRIHKTVHQLVALTFIPNPNNLKELNHKNGVKADNQPENLEWCTRRHNIQHAFDTGLNKGSQFGKCGKLHTRSKRVLSIRDTAIIEHESRYMCAKYFGVHVRAISLAIDKGTNCRGHKMYAS